MLGRSLVFSLALATCLVGPAVAQDLVGAITQQLRDQGFAEIDVKRTLLGRTRIVATRDNGQREIIVNPNTGEILRDLWQSADGSAEVRALVERPSEDGDGESNEGSGSGSDGDSGSDGGDDHEGSGHGGSGSGSGSGGDGGGDGGDGEGSGGDGEGSGGDGDD